MRVKIVAITTEESGWRWQDEINMERERGKKLSSESRVRVHLLFNGEVLTYFIWKESSRSFSTASILEMGIDQQLLGRCLHRAYKSSWVVRRKNRFRNLRKRIPNRLRLPAIFLERNLNKYQMKSSVTREEEMTFGQKKRGDKLIEREGMQWNPYPSLRTIGLSTIGPTLLG